MTELEQAARQALDALEMHAHGAGSVIHSKLAWDALREALGYCIDEGCPHRGTTHTCINPIAEQAEQEPVAWWNGKETVWFEHELITEGPVGECKIPLYTAPVRTKDLTDDEIGKALGLHGLPATTRELKDARAVIAAYKENTHA